MEPKSEHSALVRATRSNRVTMLVAAAVVFACRLLASIPCHLYDDAFITMRYARNLAAGDGFVYNPGAPWEPVLGTTTPAYTFVLAIAAALGIDLPQAAIVFNALCDAIIAVLLVRLLAGRSEMAAFIAVAAFAAMPELNRISAGGMESPLFVLTVFGAILLDASRRYAIAGLVAVLAATVRPEGVLVLPLLAVGHLRSARTTVRLLGPATMLGVAYLIGMTLTFGSPIPQSVTAKADHYLGDGGWRRVIEIFTNAFVPSVPLRVAAPLTVVGIVAAIRSRGPLRSWTVFVLTLTTAYLIARPIMPGWYYYPMLTGVSASIGLGAAILLERLLPATAALFKHRTFRATATVVLCCLVAPVAWVALRTGQSAVRDEIYTPMQSWAASATTPDTTLLAFDIGCIGYVSDARVLDAGGLVCPAAKSERSPDALVKLHRPDYALMTAVQQWIGPMQTDPVLSTTYVPIRRFTAGLDGCLAPSPDALPTLWQQDYILYARRDQVALADADNDETEAK